MATWTKMKINKLVEISWANLTMTHVKCKTLYGEMIETVPSLRNKLTNQNLLRPIRQIYQDMLDFADAKD